MKVSKFFFFLMGLFAVALIVYVVTTPSSQQVQLTGIVTGTDEIVSPLVTGRLQKLLVDEGSEVKAGQLIAEIDPTELKSARDAAAANIQTLQARVEQSSRTLAMNDEQTAAARRASSRIGDGGEGATGAGAGEPGAQRSHLSSATKGCLRRASSPSRNETPPRTTGKPRKPT